MEETTSREKVLKSIRSALLSKEENPYPSLDTESPVFEDLKEDFDITFAKAFSEVSGKFIYCEDESDLRNNIASLNADKKWKEIHCYEPELLRILDGSGVALSKEPGNVENVSAGITGCEYLVARFGSILVSSRQTGGRRMNVFPESHIVIAWADQIVPDIKDALKAVREKYAGKLPSMLSLITGPSRTADIEKTLVMGAHGPKELYLFLIDRE